VPPQTLVHVDFDIMFGADFGVKVNVARFITGSGGGYGDPKQRGPEAVLNDVLDGYLSVETAREVYAVHLGGPPLRVDKAKTSKLRGT
jgi:N-methylhydantoinase B